VKPTESTEPHPGADPTEPTHAGGPTDPPGTAAETAADAWRRQVELLAAERDSLHQKWMIAMADLDNYRRRARKEADEARRFAVLPLAEDLLPALDNLQRALEAAKTSTDASQLVQGVQMVARQFDEILGRHQISPIEALGKPFDPNLHRALQQVPGSGQPPLTVLMEYERGYQMHDRVVRPSTVIVAAPPAS
jgi:molecular chaperone GrpE